MVVEGRAGEKAGYKQASEASTNEVFVGLLFVLLSIRHIMEAELVLSTNARAPRCE